MPRITACDDSDDEEVEAPSMFVASSAALMPVKQSQDLIGEFDVEEEEYGDGEADAYADGDADDPDNYDGYDEGGPEDEAASYLDAPSAWPRSPTVYVPGGIDPAMLKRSQQNFRRTSYERDFTPPPVFDTQRQFTSPALSPRRPNLDAQGYFSPGRTFEFPRQNLPADIVRSYMNEVGVFHTVEESPCLRILRRVQEGAKAPVRYTKVGVSHSRKPVDFALFMGRSFRVGWSRTGKIVHAGQLSIPLHDSSESGKFHEDRKMFRVLVEGNLITLAVIYVYLSPLIFINIRFCEEYTRSKYKYGCRFNASEGLSR